MDNPTILKRQSAFNPGLSDFPDYSKLPTLPRIRRSLRIAYIGSRGFPGFNAGVEKSLEELCPRLAEKGHELTLYCSSQVSTTERVYKGTILRRTPAIRTKHLETISRVFLAGLDTLLFNDCDIVHFHSIGPALMSWMTRLKRCKTVVTVHGLDWQRAKWGKAARASLQIGERTSVFFPHRTIVVSKALERHYREHYGKEVHYIPNGVTVRPPLAAREIREKWGLEPREYVLFASRLVPEKECHTLVEAYKKVRTDKRLVIAGSSWYSDDYVADLKDSASSDPRILFTGWAEGDTLAELYSNAFAYCLPSHIEGLSLALLEAMSYGACPLTSDIPENTDVVGRNGVAFRTGNADDLAAKLQELVDDPKSTAALGKAARRAVQTEYSWERNADELERAYLDLLGRS